MQTLNKLINKTIYTAMFITAIIAWTWMIFAWIIAIIGG